MSNSGVQLIYFSTVVQARPVLFLMISVCTPYRSSLIRSDLTHTGHMTAYVTLTNQLARPLIDYVPGDPPTLLRSPVV